MRKTTGMTLLELVVVVGILAVLSAMLFPVLSRAREAAHRSSCQSNLKQMALAILMYADEDPTGRLPPFQLWTGDTFAVNDCRRADFMLHSPNGPSIYPEYVQSALMWICPSDLDGRSYFADGGFNLRSDPAAAPNPCRFRDQSYFYIPWLIPSVRYYMQLGYDGTADFDVHGDQGFMSALAVLNMEIRLQRDTPWYDNDIVYEHGQLGNVTLPRLRNGVERFMITDINNPTASSAAASRAVIGGDESSPTNARSRNHGIGGNLMYLDGHVEFVRFGAGHPYCNAWYGVLTHM